MKTVSSIPEHSSGAVLFRIRGRHPETLLVQSARGEWGFPKGHLEEGETTVEAAVREIREETGLSAGIREDFCIRVSYVMPNGKGKICDYYICDRFSGKETPQEGEILSLKWTGTAEAEELLPYPQLRRILRAAEAAWLAEGSTEEN